MSNNLTPDLSPSSQQTTPLFTAANLAAYQRAMADSSSTTPSERGWVCGGEMNHRRPVPNPELWNDLIKHDPLAADTEKSSAQLPMRGKTRATEMNMKRHHAVSELTSPRLTTIHTHPRDSALSSITPCTSHALSASTRRAPAPSAQHQTPSNRQCNIFTNIPAVPQTRNHSRKTHRYHPMESDHCTQPASTTPSRPTTPSGSSPHHSRTTTTSACFPFAKRHTRCRREGSRRNCLRRT